MVAPKYKMVLPSFANRMGTMSSRSLDALIQKLNKGFEEYGDGTFEKDVLYFVQEIKSELEDVPGYAVCGWEKLESWPAIQERIATISKLCLAMWDELDQIERELEQ